MTDEQNKVTIVTNSNASSARFLTGEFGPCKIPNEHHISAPPVINGTVGRAWKCDTANGLRKLGHKPEDDACLVHWLIEAPWAHPAWHSYSLVLMHLRPMPDGRETKLYFPEATHELWLYVLDPTMPRDKLLATGIPAIDHKGMWMTPKNFAAQFVEVTDDLARERVQKSVQAICDGALSPDTDWQSMWADLYGWNLIKPEHR